MSNILTAIKAIVENSNLGVIEGVDGIIKNRANQMGAALEDYVKNAFADCLGQDSRFVKQARSKTFSYLGNSNNPPDAMLIGNDAIEIKKIASLGTSQLQLNSSYPKNKLHSDNAKICNACRECEVWQEKDMIYVVGQVNGQELQNIFSFPIINIGEYIDYPYECDLPRIKEGKKIIGVVMRLPELIIKESNDTSLLETSKVLIYK